MNSYNIDKLPKNLKAYLINKNIDFIFKAKDVQTSSRLPYYLALAFAIIWLLPLARYIGPVINAIIAIVNNSNLEITNNSTLIYLFFISLILMVGVISLISSIIKLLPKSTYVVGTSNELIFYKNNLIKSIPWGNFDTNVKIISKDLQNTGDIIINKRFSNKDAQVVQIVNQVPIFFNKIKIKGVPNVTNIQNRIQQRIRACEHSRFNLY